MRRFWLICISLLWPSAALASPQALVVELRLHDDRVETLAWRDADGAISVEPDALSGLGLVVPGAADEIPLAEVPGLSYRFIAAESAIVIECTVACFSANTVSGAGPHRMSVQRGHGGFLNLDLAATYAGKASAAAGQFELGIFNRFGAGGTTWIADTERERAVRLESQWTIERPDTRTMARFGDSFTRGGATSTPFRFGGIQLATDFSLDPSFVTYPTPTLSGEAAAPSAVDLYVDGALRLRSTVDAGPFSIPDAPVLTGAGVAQLVVTDALGRQQVFAQSFYASPSMLRRGLADYSIAIGAERENFTQASADYGRGFISGVYRKGLAQWITAEARAETAAELSSLGAAASFATASIGQMDIGYARSAGAHQGEWFHAAWQRQADALSLGFDVSSATPDFRRLGEDWSLAPPRLQAAASAGLNLRRLGTASAAYTLREEQDNKRVRTVALAYTPRIASPGQVQLNAFYVDDEADEPYFTVGVGYAVTLRSGVSVGASTGVRGRRGAFSGSAQRAPNLEGGFGWRASASAGEIERADISLLHLGARDESSLEFSQTESGAGVRAQVASGLAWIDGHITAGRPVRDAFALVDAGAANVTVLRDNRPAAVTNKHGLALLTGLRPYQANRIGLVLDDLPFEVQTAADEIEVTPSGRSGVVARFPVASGSFGEARVIGLDGAPLAVGAVLVRTSNGQRVPVGYGGRIYIAGLAQEDVLANDSCTVRVHATELRAGAMLYCEAV